MTRELIIECMTCKEECEEEDSCFECAEKQLAEYENQIKIESYNQALEDFKKELIRIYNKRYMHDIYIDDIRGIVELLKR